MANRTDRKDYREDLGVVLSAALTGAGKPAQAFIDHYPDDAEFDGQSPMVCLVSAGSEQMPKRSLVGKFYKHFFNILVFVARDDPNSEDSLDNCYKTIAETVEANLSTSNWDKLDIEGRSFIDYVTSEGEPFWVETIPVSLEGLSE